MHVNSSAKDGNKAAEVFMARSTAFVMPGTKWMAKCVKVDFK